MTAVEPGRSRSVISWLALACAVSAALLIPGQPPGMHILLVTTLASIALAVSRRHELGRLDSALLTISFLLMLQFAVRTAPWVLLLDLVVASVLAVAAVFGAKSSVDVARAGEAALRGTGAGIVLTTSPAASVVRRIPDGRGPYLVRGIGIAAILLIVFGGLFISADRAFASIVRDFVLPEIDLTLIPARVFLFIVVGAAVGSLLVMARSDSPAVGPHPFGPAANGRRKLEAVEWLPGIVLLNLLFAAFVLVQHRVLFAGHTHVLRTEGLTYSEYARQGFFQLLAVAVITSGVIAAVVRLADLSDTSMRRVARWSLGLLCALTLIVLLSASVRLSLYEEAFGFTRLRLLVHATIAGLAIVFVMIFVAGAIWNGRWLTRGVFLLTGVGLVAFNLINPDLFIAQRNLERARTTGVLDTVYLAGLSEDAVPALATMSDLYPACAVVEDDNAAVWSFNLSRWEAEKLLSNLAPSGCQ